MSAPAKPIDTPVSFYVLAFMRFLILALETAANTSSHQTKGSSGAESPTTVRPLEMDDDDLQESSVLSGDAPAGAKAATVEEVPPPKPPRPLSPQQQAESTLKEAFPSIDAAVVKAVLTASGGRIEPAFNALLGINLNVDTLTTPTNSDYRYV
jgi:hypothetical protein